MDAMSPTSVTMTALRPCSVARYCATAASRPRRSLPEQVDFPRQRAVQRDVVVDPVGNDVFVQRRVADARLLLAGRAEADVHLGIEVRLGDAGQRPRLDDARRRRCGGRGCSRAPRGSAPGAPGRRTPATTAGRPSIRRWPRSTPRYCAGRVHLRPLVVRAERRAAAGERRRARRPPRPRRERRKRCRVFISGLLPRPPTSGGVGPARARASSPSACRPACRARGSAGRRGWWRSASRQKTVMPMTFRASAPAPLARSERRRRRG